MNTFDQVKCYVCGRTYPRIATLIVQTKKGRFRVCKTCYTAYESKKSKEQYEQTKESTRNIRLIVSPEELMEEKTKFLKKLQHGA